MYINKKVLMFAVFTVLCVISAFVIYGVNQYKSADERAYYWYVKYYAEKQDRAREMKNLSSIVHSAVKNSTVWDDGVGAFWFEDTEYCAKDSYCAVWVGHTSFRVIK